MCACQQQLTADCRVHQQHAALVMCACQQRVSVGVRLELCVELCFCQTNTASQSVPSTDSHSHIASVSWHCQTVCCALRHFHVAVSTARMGFSLSLWPCSICLMVIQYSAAASFARTHRHAGQCSWSKRCHIPHERMYGMRTCLALSYTRMNFTSLQRHEHRRHNDKNHAQVAGAMGAVMGDSHERCSSCQSLKDGSHLAPHCPC